MPASYHRTKKFLHYCYLLNCDINITHSSSSRATLPSIPAGSTTAIPWLDIPFSPFSSFVLTTDTSPIASKNSFNASSTVIKKGLPKGPLVYFQVSRNTLLQRPPQPSAFFFLCIFAPHLYPGIYPFLTNPLSFSANLSIASILSASHRDIVHDSTSNYQLPHRYVGGAEVRRDRLHRKRHQNKQPLPFLQAEFLLVPFRE